MARINEIPPIPQSGSWASHSLATKTAEAQQLRINLEAAQKTIIEVRKSKDEARSELMKSRIELNELQHQHEEIVIPSSEHGTSVHQGMELKSAKMRIMPLEQSVQQEENEVYMLNSDVDWLMKHRNEYRDKYDHAYAWGETEEELAEEYHAAKSGATGASHVSSGPSTEGSKISRKEADKLVGPNWPEIYEHEMWKSQVTSGIVAASGDLDHDAWIAWIAPAFEVNPDIDGVLANSSNTRFNSIDVKLATALMSIMQNGGEQAREVLNEARLKMARNCRGATPRIVKGRQLLAMATGSFRSASDTDLVYTVRHLYDLTYPGDNELTTFKSQWQEVLEMMRQTDVPNDITLIV